MKKIAFFSLSLISLMIFSMTHESHGSGMDYHARNTAVPSVRAMHLPVRTASK
jgi:hypothetical protein